MRREPVRNGSDAREPGFARPLDAGGICGVVTLLRKGCGLASTTFRRMQGRWRGEPRDRRNRIQARKRSGRRASSANPPIARRADSLLTGGRLNPPRPLPSPPCGTVGIGRIPRGETKLRARSPHVATRGRPFRSCLGGATVYRLRQIPPRSPPDGPRPRLAAARSPGPGVPAPAW